MMRKLIYLLLFINIGCKQLENKKPTSEPVKAFFGEEVQAFDFQLDDSVVLIYSMNRAFDTCMVLIINKLGDEIKGKFLYYPPTYYADFSDWKTTNAFIYKAVNFNLKLDTWQGIVANLRQVLTTANKEKMQNTAAVTHPSHSKLFFENLLRSNENAGDKFFDDVYVVLNTNIIQKLLDKYPTVNGKVP